MKAFVKNLLCIALAVSYTSIMLGGQGAVLKSMISSGGASAIESDSGKSVPSETKPFSMLRKYSLPAPGSDADFVPAFGRYQYHVPASEKITHHCVIYTILVSHFPYPPFWPRDPSTTCSVVS